MKKNSLFILILMFAGGLNGQAPADTSSGAVPIQETVISASRTTESRTAVAQQVTVLRRTSIERLNAQTTADLLANSGTVFVQKSQQGGGSPVLRGFEASRVLLVVDGVRMNNAIYRAGHLQNVITIDQTVLERAEVLFGPSSTVYGSDALGGVVAFYTKDPVLAGPEQAFRSTASAMARYGTANNEKTGHIDFSLAGRQFGSLTSFTYSDFGDLRMGANALGGWEKFGERPFYAAYIQGRDSLVRNSDPLVQKQSGYRQYDLLQKFLWKPVANQRHVFNMQYSTSGDVPRYDRLTDPGANGQGLRFAEWYYGPQERLLAAYSWEITDAGWFDKLSATASWQSIEESRHQRRFGRSDRQHRIENVGVAALTVDAQHHMGNHTLQVGIDGQFNDVQSEAMAENISTGTTERIDTRYPDGGSTLWYMAAYATHRWSKTGADGKGWAFSEGLRIGYAQMNALFTDKTFFPFPFDEVTQQTPVVSGSLGAMWYFKPDWRLSVNASSGFRVPNVDDLGKVFDSAPGQLIVPNPDLRPEKTAALDLNLSYRLANRIDWETVVWGTAMFDALLTAPFQLAGQDSVLYNGINSAVFANQNQREARIWGISTEMEMDIGSHFSAYGNVSWQRGRVLLAEGDAPLDHIPPMYGRVGGRYYTPSFSAEAFVLFNGKKPISEYQLNGEDNEQYAPPGGMPAWWTLSLRTQYRFSRFTLQAGLDNVLDAQYRTFASGINAPGRNLFVALRYNLG